MSLLNETSPGQRTCQCHLFYYILVRTTLPMNTPTFESRPPPLNCRQKEPKAEPKEENGVPKNEPVPATKPPLNCAKHGVPKHALATIMCRCMCIMPMCFCDAHVLPGLSSLARGCQGGVVPIPFAAPRLRRLQVYSSFRGMEHWRSKVLTGRDCRHGVAKLAATAGTV